MSECSSLVELPREIGRLSSLTALNLCRCGALEELPHELTALRGLISLNLSSCYQIVDVTVFSKFGNLSERY